MAAGVRAMAAIRPATDGRPAGAAAAGLRAMAAIAIHVGAVPVTSFPTVATATESTGALPTLGHTRIIPRAPTQRTGMELL
jgi:hypothetical protein